MAQDTRRFAAFHHIRYEIIIFEKQNMYEFFLSLSHLFFSLEKVIPSISLAWRRITSHTGEFTTY